MRQQKKQMTDTAEIIALLNSVPVGHLGTHGPDGFPMVKPLNFAYHEGHIYFHSAREGEKIDHIRNDNRVCFEVALPIAYVKGTLADPCRAEYLYRSVIIKGRAHIVEDREEQLAGLRCLMEKYQPEGGYADFLSGKLEITAVVRIDIEEMIGKEDLGKGALNTLALQALRENVPLPVTLVRPAE